ncbi:MAG TPA: hypothetical protein VJK03_01080 [Candidatus Nanoarchaeia archaeon]|nr:hypothetical protein [Candidatus Nanoarchaeia archaeon]
MKNTFVFLYPENEIFEHEIGEGSYKFSKEWEKEKARIFKHLLKSAKTEEEKKAIRNKAIKDRDNFFRPIYKKALNECIDLRYRINGFEIVYALLDGEPLSDIIVSHPQDRIIYAGMDALTHHTQKPDGTYPYPDQDYILNQLGSPDHLRVAGFHVWDCVEKLARRAHERGINVLVDEDLTELFTMRMKTEGFDISQYPGYNPRLEGKHFFEMFMEPRRGVPWLWQDYPEVGELPKVGK